MTNCVLSSCTWIIIVGVSCRPSTFWDSLAQCVDSNSSCRPSTFWDSLAQCIDSNSRSSLLQILLEESDPYLIF
ncbi:hypothetical protein GQ55_8G177200 [Panicum hallii var. hallii]|uniref:Secreted protein n=1 Tax=Panicum hallii var. hallii TaxID=1504633 RepID=A0A2T7CNK0_9POAL|nr:hypothetical protein GQ55_8G177200 [Panicum hallii var. hallii]